MMTETREQLALDYISGPMAAFYRGVRFDGLSPAAAAARHGLYLEDPRESYELAQELVARTIQGLEAVEALGHYMGHESIDDLAIVSAAQAAGLNPAERAAGVQHRDRPPIETR